MPLRVVFYISVDINEYYSLAGGQTNRQTDRFVYSWLNAITLGSNRSRDQ